MNKYDLIVTRMKRDKESLEEFSNTCIPKMIITNARHGALSSHRDINDPRIIKWRHRDKSLRLYPIKVFRHKIRRAKYTMFKLADKKPFDGYVALSKREFRLQNPPTLHFNRAELDECMLNEVKEFVNKYNYFLTNNMYRCSFYHGGQLYDFKYVMANNYKRLIKSIEARLDFLDDEFDEVLAGVCKQKK